MNPKYMLQVIHMKVDKVPHKYGNLANAKTPPHVAQPQKEYKIFQVLDGANLIEFNAQTSFNTKKTRIG
jgi:hypothetical protein